MIIEALTQANVRGILATGWGGLEAMDLPENILKIEKAPHDWLFPRMAAVVHHGGAGTTAAGLRAGKPSSSRFSEINLSGDDKCSCLGPDLNLFFRRS